MQCFDWNAEKNQQLKLARGITFDEIVLAIVNGHVQDVIEHPNQQQYPGQMIYVIEIDNYIYLVPFVQEGESFFLKTIIPSRKATKQYLRRNT
jgi:uncharacterized DUF497 family protein